MIHRGSAVTASGAADGAPPLLCPDGACVILGASDPDRVAVPIAPSPVSLFAPRGAVLAGPHGPLWVSDTGHHRLLGWRRIPEQDNTPADLVIGQVDFLTEGRNANRIPGAATFQVPTGIAAENGVLAVADAWNHRVLIWRRLPERNNAPADIVAGQIDFSSNDPNRGNSYPGAESLYWPSGVAISEGRLLVADTGNRRVLVWNRIPEKHGAAADLVLGQSDFRTRDENSGEAPGPRGMRWPHGITRLGDTLCVCDAGNSRIMAWRSMPGRNGEACDLVLGQSSMHAAEHNGGHYQPVAASMNMPYGIAALRGALAVADTANSRILGFGTNLLSAAAAQRLSGQRNFAQKGDNRWGAAARDSLCWPYAIAACDTWAVISDSGNNRVMLWRAM